MPAVGKSWLAPADAAGKLLAGAIPAAAVTEAELAQALTAYGRDRGAGNVLPSTDLRRGDVYFYTAWGCLLTYTSAGWRQLDVPTLATFAARNTATASFPDALHNGFRIYLTADLGEQVWNGSFWTPINKHPAIRAVRTGSTGYNTTTYLAVPYDVTDAAQTHNPDEEWFQPLLAVSERRILVKRAGEYLMTCNFTSSVGTTTFTRINTSPAANAPDYTFTTAGGQSAMSVVAKARLAAGTYIGASHYSPQGGDTADGSGGFRNDLIITRIGD